MPFAVSDVDGSSPRSVSYSRLIGMKAALGL
jgi:hypothetical protein